MKNITIFLSTLLFVFKIYPNDMVTISSDMYNIDKKNKLIIVNENIDEINEKWTQLKSSISMGDIIYNMEFPVEKFILGQAYRITESENIATYNLYFTELPIIKITIEDTNEINKNSKVPATFSMVEQNKNKITSTIGIRYRGVTSISYPKKQYRIEFLTQATSEITKDVSLLGMRSDDDWNLIAMYNEPLRIRNKTSFDIWRSINSLHYQASEPGAVNSVRLKYAELLINDEYRGIYCVGEPVDRKQLKLKKYDEIAGIRGELYKGIDWGEAARFVSASSYVQGNTTWDGFEFKYPDEISPYWNNIYDFVNFVLESSNEKFYSEYKSKFNFDNLVDYFIFLNLARAADNTAKNIFIAKYKEDAPYFYVPWDLDGVFGNDWKGNKENVINYLLYNGLYRRLLNDEYRGNDFKKKVKQRWNQLVKEGLTPDNLIARFKENHDYLLQNGIYERESIVWEQYDYTFDDFTYLSTWLTNRYNYLNREFNKYDSYSEKKPNVFINEISGNGKWLEIYNAENTEVNLSGYIIQKIDEDGIIANWRIPSNTKIAADGFLYWAQNNDCTDGSTFTWGISAKKNVAFKIYDLDNNEIDFFEVKMPDLYSEGNNRTVGRETDGADKLVIFNKGTPGASNNDFSNVLLMHEIEKYKIQSGVLVILNDVSLVTITDYSGKLILKRPTSKDDTIDLNRLPFGVYVLQLHSKDKTEAIKFVR